jgi:hypothetical protein
MVLFSCYSGLAQQNLLFNEEGFHRWYKETGLQKLQLILERDPTIGSKVMVFFSCYSGLAPQDLFLKL